jgi:hypothetical protein
MISPFFDSFVKSPSAALRGNFVVVAHRYVRLTPQFLGDMKIYLPEFPLARSFPTREREKDHEAQKNRGSPGRRRT